jgi:hypothetical protein
MGPRESEEDCESSTVGNGNASVKNSGQDIPGNEYKPEDKRELYLLEGRTPIRCYDEREVDFFVPIYDKIGKDCIHEIQITIMFVFMDQRYNGRTHWLGKDGPLLFASIISPTILSRGTKSLSMLCGTYEEAEQMHQIAVERVRTTPFVELENVYSNIYVFATIR